MSCCVDLFSCMIFYFNNIIKTFWTNFILYLSSNGSVQVCRITSSRTGCLFRKSEKWHFGQTVLGRVGCDHRIKIKRSCFHSCTYVTQSVPHLSYQFGVQNKQLMLACEGKAHFIEKMHTIFFFTLRE